MQRRIIILGASGFIGSRILLRAKQNQDFETEGYSSKDCNLLNPEAVKNTLSHISRDNIIVVASAITRLRGDPFDSMIKNISMAHNLAKILEDSPVRQVIFLSTCDVYGLVKDGVLINEKLPPAPYDYYSVSKLASEFILRRACLKNNIALCVLRLSGVYGPGDENKSTINKIVRTLLEEKKMTIFGDGKNKRDFVYVDDICEIIQRVVSSKYDGTLNIATGISHSILEIAQLLKSLLREKVAIAYKPLPENAEVRVKDTVYDTSLFRNTFGDFKFTGLKDGLNLYLKEYKKVQNTYNYA